MRWSKSSPVASSTVSLRPEVQPFAAGAHFSHSSVKPPAPVISSYAALCGSVSMPTLMLLLSGSELQSQTKIVVGSSADRLVEQLGGLRERDVRAERLEVGVDEPEPLGAGAYVDPLVPAVEADRVAQQRDLEVDVEHRLALVEHRQPVLDVHQHDVAHGQPDVAGVGDSRSPVKLGASTSARGAMLTAS